MYLIVLPSEAAGAGSPARTEPGNNGVHPSPNLIAAGLTCRRLPPPNPTNNLPLSLSTSPKPPCHRFFPINPSCSPLPRHHGLRCGYPRPPGPPHARHRDQLRRHRRRCGTHNSPVTPFLSCKSLFIWGLVEPSRFYAYCLDL